MKVGKINLIGTDKFAKVVKDVLRSLKVEVVKKGAIDFDELEIFNELINKKVITRLKVGIGGREYFFRNSSIVRPDERLGAEANRLVKRNVYRLLVDNFGLEELPYGILHGVRPTKIIQRWLREGFGVTSHGIIDRDKISRRLQSDFLTSFDKAELLKEVALRQLPIIDEKKIGVYVGIPFCKTRCLYCSFPSQALPGDDVIADFMTALTRDIESAAESIKRYGFKVQTIYIGGGTPSALPEKFFAEMLETVHKNFYCEGVEEFTVECGRPDTITADKIDAMKRFNVTRVSVNPQTMHQRTLDLIGRKHTVEDIVKAYHELRAAHDWFINMDLIIGLPGERLNDFKETLDKILELKPDDVTVHSLAIKRGSKLQTRLADDLNKLEDFDLPSDDEVRLMSEHAAKVLRREKFLPYYLYRQGYMRGQIENVGWCKPGAEGIYNVQMMGERQIILGVGSAASTKVPDFAAKRVLGLFNAKDLKTYLQDLERYITRREKLLEAICSAAQEEGT